MEYIGMSELMPGFPQLVDHDRLPRHFGCSSLAHDHTQPVKFRLCSRSQTQIFSRGVFLAAHVDKEAALLNAPMLIHRSGRSQALDLRGFEKSRRHNLPEFRSAMQT